MPDHELLAVGPGVEVDVGAAVQHQGLATAEEGHLQAPDELRSVGTAGFN